MTTSGRIENPGITVAPCRSPSPKITRALAPDGLGLPAPSTTPGAPPGPARGGDRGHSRRSGASWATWAGWDCTSPRSTGGSGYRVARAGRRGRGARAGRRARAVRAHGDRRAPSSPACRRRRVAAPSLLPGLADGSVLAGVGAASAMSSERTARPPVRLGGPAAADWPRSWSLPVGRRRRIVRRLGREARDGRDAAQPRPDAALGPGHPRRRAGRGPARRAADAPRPGPAHRTPPRRSAWPASAPSWPPPTPRCASSSADPSPCSRPSSTTAPTWRWPSSWPRPLVWDAARAAEHGGDQLTYTAAMAAAAGAAGRRPRRQPQHPGPRRHRLHLGARRPPVPAPGHR